MGTFGITFDPVIPRVVLHAEGELDGPTFAHRLLAWIATAGCLFGHDRLYDLRRYAGTVDYDDVRCVGLRMRDAGADVAQGCTDFVSLDPGFFFWVRSMRLELPRRRMEVVASMEAAEALLAEPR